MVPLHYDRQSRDGIHFQGCPPHRLDSRPQGRSRGGKEALRVMVNGVNENRIGGHIVDGPTGPPRIIKPGLLALAITPKRLFLRAHRLL